MSAEDDCSCVVHLGKFLNICEYHEAEKERARKKRLKVELERLSVVVKERKAERDFMGIFPSQAFHLDINAEEMESINQLKGIVSVAPVIEISGEVASSRPKGYYKSWANSIALCNVIKDEIRDGHLTFRRKKVLELSCNTGLPGIFACLKGASMVDFVDRNAEDLRYITAPNVLAYVKEARDNKILQTLAPAFNFYAAEWEELPDMLSLEDGGYDIILMAWIPYTAPSTQKLYTVIKKCLRRPHGVLYLASSKKRPDAARHLTNLVDKEEIFGLHLVRDLADFQIWKFFQKV